MEEDERDDDDLFSWNEYVRPGDPETSHEAAEELDIENDSFIAWVYFCEVYTSDGVTATDFEQYVENELFDSGWDTDRAHRRAESLRRRLSDLEDKFKRIETRKDEQGKRLKRNKQQIYFLTE